MARQRIIVVHLTRNCVHLEVRQCAHRVDHDQHEVAIRHRNGHKRSFAAVEQTFENVLFRVQEVQGHDFVARLRFCLLNDAPTISLLLGRRIRRVFRRARIIIFVS